MLKAVQNRYAWHVSLITIMLFMYYFIKVEMAGAVISNLIILVEVFKGIGKWK